MAKTTKDIVFYIGTRPAPRDHTDSKGSRWRQYPGRYAIRVYDCGVCGAEHENRLYGHFAQDWACPDCRKATQAKAETKRWADDRRWADLAKRVG